MDLSNHLPVVKAVEAVLKRRPHIQTVRRWCKKGCRGIRLNAMFVNGQYLTTIADVEAYLRDTTQARLVVTDPPKVEIVKPIKPARVQKAVAEFERMTSGSKSARCSSIQR
jgi:hypothetical protein